MIRILIFFLFSVSLAACNSGPDNNPGTVKTPSPEISLPAEINYTVTKTYPHDTSSYTEGFLFYNNQLFESTGSTPETPASRRSVFGIVNLQTGRIDVKAELDKKKYFGEGIIMFNGKIFQLTWTTKTGFIYDAKTYKRTGEFTFNSTTGEGWGLTSDSTYLLMSDGSSNIQYLDPNTLKVIKILGVTDNNGPVSNINELEFIHGFIYANKYQTTTVLKIDPASGRVVGTLDFSALKKEAESKNPDIDYLNGIAYDPATDRIFITGKLWPDIYEVKFPH